MIAQAVAKCGQTLIENLLPMSHEQQPSARERLSQPRVVDGRHHGLPCACGRDEQVSVVAMLPRDGNLLEQSLLKWLWAKLDGAKLHARRRS